MKAVRYLLVGVAVAVCTACNGDTPARVDLVLVNASVIDIESGEVVSGMSIAIKAGRIFDVRSGAAPFRARVVDVSGAFVVPGLCDAHVHIQREDDLWAYVLHGVTTIRDMKGSSQTLRLRSKGNAVFPTIVAASPSLESGAVSPATQNQRTVGDGDVVAVCTEFANASYDGIKLRSVDRSTHEKALIAASKLRVPIWGHVPVGMSVSRAAELGQSSVEHMEPWLPPIGPPLTAAWWRAASSLDSQWMPNFHRRPIYSVPTLAYYDSWDRARAAKSYDSPLTPRIVKVRWRRAAGFIHVPSVTVRRAVEKMAMLCKRMNDTGQVVIVAGSDAGGVPLLNHGSALHRELDLLAAGGFSTLECLRAATTNPAAMLGQSDEFGSVSVGARADLLVIDENPLGNLSALRNPRSVILRGRLIDRAGLRKLREALLDSVQDRATVVNWRTDASWRAAYQVEFGGELDGVEKLAVWDGGRQIVEGRTRDAGQVRYTWRIDGAISRTLESVLTGYQHDTFEGDAGRPNAKDQRSDGRIIVCMGSVVSAPGLIRMAGSLKLEEIETDGVLLDLDFTKYLCRVTITRSPNSPLLKAFAVPEGHWAFATLLRSEDVAEVLRVIVDKRGIPQVAEWFNYHALDEQSGWVDEDHIHAFRLVESFPSHRE